MQTRQKIGEFVNFQRVLVEKQVQEETVGVLMPGVAVVQGHKAKLKTDVSFHLKTGQTRR